MTDSDTRRRQIGVAMQRYATDGACGAGRIMSEYVGPNPALRSEDFALFPEERSIGASVEADYGTHVVVAECRITIRPKVAP